MGRERHGKSRSESSRRHITRRENHDGLSHDVNSITSKKQSKQLEGKWAHLFPRGSDPIGDLIREREREDEEID